TKGKNRLISRAEVLGRLFFCGFNVIAEEEKEDRIYFIAQKVKTPSLDESPSYGPLVQLNRYGSNGTPMKVYKFRTMYPYSEYLQEYVYRLQRLQRGGKFKDDFRVTELGRFMRSTWIDELPMLYNWIKGDMKLFGVRPLSQHYLSLYDEELQALRAKVKPGLVPPFYADLPETLEEIKESERRYIKSYLHRPIRTQFSYLRKAFVNILIKGARSQ
ncbi:MAG: sugar transferase, partial [Desulfobacteraceae bacterium]